MKDNQEINPDQKDPNHVALQIDNIFQPLKVTFNPNQQEAQEVNENE